jgi:hypothetical protein
MWSDSALADDEKIAALKWLNEVQQRTWHAHAGSAGYSPREYAQIVTGHLSNSRVAAACFSESFKGAVAHAIGA